MLTLTLLGTGAADGIPNAFCRCPNCEGARRSGGPSLRMRSAALLGDDLLIDLGPDIMTAAQAHGVRLTEVRFCLQTHPHSDHLDLSHLLNRSPEYGVPAAPRLEFHASAETLGRAAEMFVYLSGMPLLSHETEAALNCTFHAVRPFETFAAGPYRVTPVPANHAPGLGALCYIIEREGRALFYGTDTARFSEATLAALRERRFGLMVLDHCYGPAESGDDHLGARDVAEYVRRFRAEGTLAPDGRVFATHIAHAGNPPHLELAAFGRAHGYEVAYDGLVLTI